MTDGGQYEILVEGLRTSGGIGLRATITQGEIASVIASEYGGLKKAAIDAHVSYKSLSEYKRVVSFYGPSSAGQTLIDNSFVRALIDDYPTLCWTHLREAAKLRDFEDAMDNLMVAVDEAMTPRQFTRHIARLRKKNGEKPPRIVIDNDRGLRVIIERR